MKGFSLFLVGVGLLFALVVVLEGVGEEPLDWRPNYERASSDPLGGAVLYAAVEAWAGDALRVESEPPYLALAGSPEASGTTYWFVTETFAPDAAELGRLLAFARRGGTVFAAATEFGGPLGDSLGVYTDRPGFTTTFFGVDDEPGDALFLVQPGLEWEGGYRIAPRLNVGTLLLDDWASDSLAAPAEVLGITESGAATLVRVPVGEGAVVLSSTPGVFSNYALLRDDAFRYTDAVLGLLPNEQVVWDAHHKPQQNLAATPLRFVVSRPALRLAYHLSLLMGLLFLVFRGRRWQRPVPVLAEPPNAVVGFAETLGRLRHQRGEGGRLVQRKAVYLRDRLRHRLGITVPDLSDASAEHVARRTGVDPDRVLRLFRALDRHAAARTVPDHTLIQLDRMVRLFFRDAQR